MKLLITGASGFVGGAIWRRARELGWDVRGLGRRSLLDSDYISADLTRPLRIDFRPDCVIHAAARSSPWGPRKEFEQQNVVSTQHIVDFCSAQGRPHLTYISSGAVLYRDEHQTGISESTPVPTVAINEYARTKRQGELAVEAYSGSHCILRPRAVFGPGDTVVFPRILRALTQGKLPLIESDRTVVGDLVYIDTLAEYILRASQQRATGVYNITNGEPVAIYDFIGNLCTQLGLPIPRKKVSARKAMAAATAIEMFYRWAPWMGEPPITRFGISVFAYSKTFNVEKCRRELGSPLVGIKDGLKAFVAWQRAQLT